MLKISASTTIGKCAMKHGQLSGCLDSKVSLSDSSLAVALAEVPSV